MTEQANETITNEAPTTEVLTPTMAETLVRLEAKLDEICAKLDARPTRTEMNEAIETRVDAATLDITGLLNDRVTVEQVQDVVDATLEPVVATVEKLTNTIERVTILHEQALQRWENLHEIMVEHSVAIKQQTHDIESLEDAGRDRDLSISTTQADGRSTREKVDTVHNTVMPHNGEGGLMGQSQTMMTSIGALEDMVIDIKPTIVKLNEHRIKQQDREARRRAFVRSRSGASSIGLTAAWLVGNWAGLIDGNLIGLVIKFYIGGFA